MSFHLGASLVASGDVPAKVMAQALVQARAAAVHVVEVLLRTRALSEEKLEARLALWRGAPNHDPKSPLPMLVAKLPRGFCRRLMAVPLAQDNQGTVRAVALDPGDPHVLRELSHFLGIEVTLERISYRPLRALFDGHPHLFSDVPTETAPDTEIHPPALKETESLWTPLPPAYRTATATPPRKGPATVPPPSRGHIPTPLPFSATDAREREPLQERTAHPGRISASRLRAAVARVGEHHDRDAILDTLLSGLGEFCEEVFVLVLSRGMWRGWRARGISAPATQFRDLTVAKGESPLLDSISDPKAEAELLLGFSSEDPLAPLLRAAFGEAGRAARSGILGELVRVKHPFVAAPLLVGDRVAAAVLAGVFAPPAEPVALGVSALCKACGVALSDWMKMKRGR